MQEIREQLNRFLVSNFNSILRWEEQALSTALGGKLTVSEFHVIEAVIQATALGENSMSEVASRLGVTVGTLTTAAKTLAAKGFLLRQRGEQDKRMVWLLPTPAALEANLFHEQFHHRMVEGIMDCLDRQQLEALASALEVLGSWFADIKAESRYISINDNEENDKWQ